MTSPADLPDPGPIRISADEAQAFFAALGAVSDDELAHVKASLRKAVDDASTARDVAIAVIEAVSVAPSILRLLKGLA